MRADWCCLYGASSLHQSRFLAPRRSRTTASWLAVSGRECEMLPLLLVASRKLFYGADVRCWLGGYVEESYVHQKYVCWNVNMYIYLSLSLFSLSIVCLVFIIITTCSYADQIPVSTRFPFLRYFD